MLSRTSWCARQTLFLAAVLLLSLSGCSPEPGTPDTDNCGDAERYSTYNGESACRTKCVTDKPCAANRECLNGVCIPSTQDAGDADGMSPQDTGPCAPQERQTIYRDVKKCRPSCDGDDDCSGDLECEDGYCVDRSLPKPDTSPEDTGTDTTDTQDTRDTSDTPAITPGRLTCHQITRCRAVCSNDTCRRQVVSTGSIDGTRNYFDYRRCVRQNCPGSNQNCIQANCRNRRGTGPADKCFPKRVSQSSLSCSEVYKCAIGCGVRNAGDQCTTDCLNRATQQGRRQVQALERCFRNECGNNAPPNCRSRAARNACNREWTNCYECP